MDHFNPHVSKFNPVLTCMLLDLLTTTAGLLLMALNFVMSSCQLYKRYLTSVIQEIQHGRHLHQSHGNSSQD